MEKKSSSKKKKMPLFIKIIIVLLIIISAICVGMVGFLNVIPIKYLIIAFIVVGIVDLIFVMLLRKKDKPRKIGLVLTILFMALYIVGIVYLSKTYNFLNKINDTGVSTVNYVVVVKKEDNFEEIDDLRNTVMGVLSNASDDYNTAKSKLNKQIDFDEKEEDDSYLLTDSLINNKVDGYLLEESQEKILEENYDNYLNLTKVIYTFSISVQEEDVTKEADMTKDSFNFLISGIDTYGKINTVSRSDVNILVTVNPNTGHISLVHIPRDYYVQLYKKSGLKDKLTHAGIYGVDTSVKTVENLLNIDINYYIKFNFTSVIKIVDTLGGITVYSDQTFTSGLYDDNTNETYTYVKGYNTLNGKEALSFCRERHSLVDGDRARGVHQEAVIEAIIKKLSSSTVLTKYTKLLDNLSDTFVTNIGEENMTNFIKMQLDKNIKWDVVDMVMDGTSSMEYTYSYPRQKLYVMLPSDDSIREAQEQIASVYNN